MNMYCLMHIDRVGVVVEVVASSNSPFDEGWLPGRLPWQQSLQADEILAVGCTWKPRVYLLLFPMRLLHIAMQFFARFQTYLANLCLFIGL